MRLWILLPDEKLTDDRAYLIGHLQTLFDEIEFTTVSRFAPGVPHPERRPDMILNLISSRSRALLRDIDSKALLYGVPLSPPSEGSWRTEDKRTYLVDFPDVSPPTVVAKSIEDVEAARRKFGGDIVVKDPFGMRGEGIERISSAADLQLARRLLEHTIGDTGQLVVQPYMSGFAKGDKRVIVQRTPANSFEIIAYFRREPPEGGWKSNLRNGGHVSRCELSDAEAELALSIAPRTGIDHAGLDISEHAGRLYYIEHNQGYGGISDFDIDRGAKCVHRCGRFILHVARSGRPDVDRLKIPA